MGEPKKLDWRTCKTQNEWKVYLKHLVRTNDRALVRAILLVYANQTWAEQEAGESMEHNGVGFTQYDATSMSRIAEKLKAQQPLTDSELEHARWTMPKYWKQLMVVSKQTVAKKAEEEYNRLKAEREAQFREANEQMCKCMESGQPCEYGICDECIVGRGVQMHL